MSLQSEVRVLVVDDVQDTVDSTVQLLNYVGYRAVGAADGLHALKLAGAMPPRVVLLDLAMPGYSGDMLATDLRRLPGMDDAILICITGYTDEAFHERARRAGCDHVILKPVEWPVLLSAMSRLLRKKEVN